MQRNCPSPIPKGSRMTQAPSAGLGTSGNPKGRARHAPNEVYCNHADITTQHCDRCQDLGPRSERVMMRAEIGKRRPIGRHRATSNAQGRRGDTSNARTRKTQRWTVQGPTRCKAASSRLMRHPAEPQPKSNGRCCRQLSPRSIQQRRRRPSPLMTCHSLPTETHSPLPNCRGKLNVHSACARNAVC